MKRCVLVLCLVSLSGCGPKQYHTAVVANTSIAQAIFAMQDAEIAAHNAKLITDQKHAAYKGQILTLLQAGDDLTLALKDWDPAKPVPANVGLAIGHVQGLLTDLQLNSPQATALLYTVQTVLSVLRGSGVLPAAAGPTATAAIELQTRPSSRWLDRDVSVYVNPHTRPNRQAPDRLSHAHLRSLPLVEVA